LNHHNNGQVPFLTHGELKLPESVAIMTYIADTYGLPTGQWHPAADPAASANSSSSSAAAGPREAALARSARFNAATHWQHLTVRRGCMTLAFSTVIGERRAAARGRQPHALARPLRRPAAARIPADHARAVPPPTPGTVRMQGRACSRCLPRQLSPSTGCRCAARLPPRCRLWRARRRPADARARATHVAHPHTTFTLRARRLQVLKQALADLDSYWLQGGHRPFMTGDRVSTADVLCCCELEQLRCVTGGGWWDPHWRQAMTHGTRAHAHMRPAATTPVALCPAPPTRARPRQHDGRRALVAAVG
jgi:glutathione S-transferase